MYLLHLLTAAFLTIIGFSIAQGAYEDYVADKDRTDLFGVALGLVSFSLGVFSLFTL